MNRKICVVTGTRAEYGLLCGLMKKIQNDSALDLQLAVTGAHLSPEFGLTYREIEKDGFHIDEKIEMLLSGDTPVAVTKSMGVELISFAEVFDRLKTDIVVLLGDRYEMLIVATAAMMARIPIAHISGGDTTEGILDEAIRHSISKMSLLHFPSTETYKKRIVQMGENPARVFNVGAIGLDNIKNLKLLSKNEFENAINFKLRKINFLVTYHPVTLSETPVEISFQKLLNVLDSYPDAGIIFTQPNADSGGRSIYKVLEEYASRNKDRTRLFKTMGQIRYLSALQYVDAVIGNSSSGIMEVPAFFKPTVNIGVRQKGRIMADSVISCDENENAIKAAVEKALSAEFNSKIKNQSNPYWQGGAIDKILNVLKNYDLSPECLMKPFYNLEFELK